MSLELHVEEQADARVFNDEFIRILQNPNSEAARASVSAVNFTRRRIIESRYQEVQLCYILGAVSPAEFEQARKDRDQELSRLNE